MPLTDQQFRRALRVGHGRARMHLDFVEAADVRAAILDAARVCGVYDPEVEGLPTQWFADFCERAGVVEELIASGAGPSHRDRLWRGALLAEFVRRGNSRAREALYSACVPTEYGGLHASSEIVELDGDAGLVFVAERAGVFMRADPNFDVNDGLAYRFDLEHGDGAALRLLSPLAAGNSAIATYVAWLREDEAKVSSASEAPRRSIEEIVEVIRDSQRDHFWLLRWARDADPADLEPIVRLATSESSSLVIENAVRCLSGSRALPLKRELLPLVRHDQREVRELAAHTLGRHMDPAVREAGLALLGDDISVALELLRRNARSEDVSVLVERLEPFPDSEAQHAVGYDLLKLFAGSPDIREPALALYVYELSPCQNCRGSAVRHLLAWEKCPDWVRREAHFDASEEVRGLVT